MLAFAEYLFDTASTIKYSHNTLVQGYFYDVLCQRMSTKFRVQLRIASRVMRIAEPQ